MSNRERISSPATAVRDLPARQERSEPERDMAAALNRVAETLADINRNLAVLITRIDGDPLAVARLAASLEGESKG